MHRTPAADLGEQIAARILSRLSKLPPGERRDAVADLLAAMLETFATRLD